MKLLSFNELILEKLISSINESVIYYSPKLNSILKKIAKKDNKIAIELLDLEGHDVKPDVTYIDFGSEEGFLSFITMKEVKKKLKSLGISDDTIDTIIDGGEHGKVITNSLYKNDALYGVFSKSRNPIKIGKLLNKVLNTKYTDAEKEDFVNTFKSKLLGDDKVFELVEGNEIPFWYKEKNYSEISKGQLGSSCMRNVQDSYFDIYSNNPEVCKLLILKEDDKIFGRSIIWKVENDKNLDFEYFMDRQYTISDSDVKKFRDYAEEKGWAFKQSNSYSDTYGVIYKGVNYNLRLTTKLKNMSHDYFPYVDTLKLYNPNSGELSNDENNSEDYEGWYLLTSTGGGYEEVESGHWSDWHDCMIPEDEAVYSDILGDWIREEDSVEVENGSRSNYGYYPEDHNEIIYDQYNNYHIHIDDTTYCQDYNSNVDSDTVVEVITNISSDDGGVSDYSYYWEEDDDIVDIPSNLDWYSILSNKWNNWGDYTLIHRDLLTKDINDDYIPHVLSIEVFELKTPIIKGEKEIKRLREIDAEVLGVEINNEHFIIDKISYYKEISEIIEDLYRKTYSLKRILSDQLSGKDQLRIDFGDDILWKSKTYSKIHKLSKLVDDVEDKNFLERNFEI